MFDSLSDPFFDGLVREAFESRGAAGVGAWARVENASAARRLAAMADVLAARLAAVDSAERDQWCLDNWDSVSAEVAAGQGVSLGVAANQLLVAWELRERMPRVAEVFAAGQLSYRLVTAVVARTRLITDTDAQAKVDTEIAARAAGWATLSKVKLEAEIDFWVDRYDPHALVRSEQSSRSRHVDVAQAGNGTGVAWITGALFAGDGAALDKRLDEMARGVCDGDPRTLDQRRADALGALAAKADRLACACNSENCPAGERVPGVVVVHVIAEEASVSDDTAVQLDGQQPMHPGSDKPLREMTIAEALAPPPPNGPAAGSPALIIGGGIIPAPLVAAKLAGSATIRRLVHPGQSPPEQRYIPSRALADFVRCRDITCRFPGCDVPADRCDIDHTIPYADGGPTQASNLKCECRKHHLLKTFWVGTGGWSEVQSPDGTVVWTAPGGQTYTTVPGSRVLFPTLCTPTAPIVVRPSATVRSPGAGAAMPRRRRTRAQERADRIAELRAQNDDYVARRNQPPPF